MRAECGNCYCGWMVPGECGVMREMRQTPAERLADYKKLIEKRKAELDGEKGVDVSYKLQKLGVPREAISGIRSPSPTAALRAARRFEANPTEHTLVLIGAHGCGKSTAAAHALGNFVQNWEWNSEPSGGKPRAPAIWMKADEVALVTDFGRVEPEWLEGLRRARFLVVDDLGKDGTAPGIAALASLLCERHEKHARTVVTANGTLAELEKRYGEAWLDRLQARAIIPDLRGEKSLRKREEWSRAAIKPRGVDQP